MKLTAEYIDSLMSKISELRNHVRPIEDNCETETPPRPVYTYRYEEQFAGDVSACSLEQARKKQISHTEQNRRKIMNNNKLDRPKSLDNPKSIYTAKEHKINSSSRRQNQVDCCNISKNQKEKSNASIVMSLHNSGNNLIKVNPQVNSNVFETAAEEFIEQAEELKSKIGYILECCGCKERIINNACNSETPSIGNYRPENTSDMSSGESTLNRNLSDNKLKYLFGAVNYQYKEILESLSTIENHIKSLNQASIQDSKKIKVPDVCADLNEPSGKTAKLTKSKRQRLLGANFHRHKTKKDKPANKNLEPVVMVYEPIQPECSNVVNEVLRAAPMDRKKDGQKQKFGFVVTYTPDIAPNSDLESKKRKKTKKSKNKIMHCLGL